MKIIHLLILIFISYFTFDSTVIAQWKRIKPDGDEIGNIVEYTDSSTMKTSVYLVDRGVIDFTISATMNFGSNWSDLFTANGYATSNLSIRKKGNLIYDFLIGSNNGLFRSSDGGKSWNNFDSGLNNGESVNYIGFCGNTTDSIPGYFISTFISPSYGGTYYSGIYYLNNKNGIWIQAIYSLNGKDVPIIISSTVLYNPNSHSTYILAGTVNYGLIKSTDGGITWIHTVNSYSDYVFYSFNKINTANSSGNELYGVTNHGILHSIDYGTTWSSLSNDPFIMYGGNFNGSIFNIVPANNQSGKLFLAGTSRGTIYYSEDNCASWKLTDNTGIIFYDYSGIENLVNVGQYLIATANSRGAWIRPINELVTAVQKEVNLLPEDFTLNQNYPNPFNPTTVISYQLPVFSHVLLKVYDDLGREVVTLVDNFQQAGNYKVSFKYAKQLSSGVYFYTIKAGNFSETKKMLMLK